MGRMRRFFVLILCLICGAAAALAQEQPETLPLTVGTNGYAVTVADLEKMPTTTLMTRTPFLLGTTKFEGVLLRDLLKAAGLAAPKLVMTALNDYRVEVPFADAEQYDVIVAYKVDGQYMRVRDKGPFWLIYPIDGHPELDNEQTATKMIWQMKSIDGE